MMVVFSANKPNKTVTLHKEGCQRIPIADLHSCGCGKTGNLGNQQWYCGKHITLEKINEFMNNRFWAVLLCDACFRDKSEINP
jgi:hypothetical protein